MKFRVICISRTLAAGGEDIGRDVAEKLGFRVVDQEIITKAADLARVDPSVVAATEQHRPFLKRVLERLTSGADLADQVTLAAGLPMEFFQPATRTPRADPEDLRLLIRAAIEDVAERGNAVIVAHAASMALAGQPGVLRVLVTASAETRAKRLAAQENLSPKDAAAAIAKSDTERAAYFQTFYQLKQELPTHYDLIVNTDAISPTAAASLIAHTAAGSEP